jgi:hypothetical protein
MQAQFVKVQMKGVADVDAEFRDIAKNQLPFANALALTKTAQDAQGGVRDALPVRFTIRRAAWMRSNIKIVAAKKADPVASVEDTFDAMARDEFGGEKVPTRGRKVLAVPLSMARPTPQTVIPTRDRPAALMQSGLAFIRGNVLYKVPRRTRIGRVNWRRGLQGPQLPAAQGPMKPIPMYALVQRADVKPRYEFQTTVEQVVQQRFDPNFQAAFKRAVNTATR